MKLILLTLLIAATGLLVFGENVITCDGDIHHLSCDYGVIWVYGTIYGRADSNICHNLPGQNTDTSCAMYISTIAERCNGLKECNIRTDLLNIPDPCKGTSKYYATGYQCVNGRTAVICEHGYSTLDCGGSKILIINAIFGRTDSETCAKEPNSLTTKSNCYAPNSYQVVASMCHGRTSCTVEASSTAFSPFSGTCKQTSKYLTVFYICDSAT